MTYQFAEINGTKIHYDIQGEGTAVVLIHAGIVNLDMWQPQMDAFSKRHRVLRYDMRGWGKTTCPDGTYSHHDDLHDLMKYVGMEEASLVGVSYGGKNALDFALTYPDKVQKLILVGPGLGGYENWDGEGIADKEEAMEAAYARGERTRSAELDTQIWFDGPRRTPDQVDQAIRREVYEMVLHTHSLPEDEGERLDIQPPAIERLAEVTAPTLLITGEEDAPDIHAIAQILEQRVPDVRRKTMTGAAHLPSMENPAAFNQIVLSFLAD